MEGLAYFAAVFFGLWLLNVIFPGDGTTSGPTGGSRTYPPDSPKPKEAPPSNHVKRETWEGTCQKRK